MRCIKGQETRFSKPQPVNTALLQVLRDGDLTLNPNPVAHYAAGYFELQERRIKKNGD